MFGQERLARKRGSYSFSRAIFDALIFFAADVRIGDAMRSRPESVKAAYEAILDDQAFIDAVESDTAGIPHTHERLARWGTSLREATGLLFAIPELRHGRIHFNGFWH
jgi:hypothetical protein